ncbi:hypothetical protein [Maridesulfovibrio frigidus]|uniref:hypothetical protein n=1 Tax=Maridesulfovibrio frigidus TaxID=340956 RepID=UPI0004E11416|nr:hypothetical protein [Maridesulfovibrio frigidus]
MRNTFIIMIFALIMSFASPAFCSESIIPKTFGKLSEVESALKKIGQNLDKIAGSASQPDRVFALQDLANLCKTSRMQVHGLNSLYSVANVVKREKRFESKEAAMLKEKCRYATNDFLRRKTFVHDIIVKTRDQKLKDLAYILEVQLDITLNNLSIISKNLK